MNLAELQSRLRNLGVDIPQNTLKRWGYDGLIPRPQRYKKGKGGGKGRAVSWDENAILEAAAVWAIRHNKIMRKVPSRKLIPYIKRSAVHVYEGPGAVYAIPPITDPSQRSRMTYEDVKMTLLYDRYKDIEVPQPDEAIWHSLLTTWIAAEEKAKRNWPITEPAHVIFHWSSRQIDAWSQKTCDLSSISLERSESDKDEIFFLEDGIDTREKLWNLGFFPIKTA